MNDQTTILTKEGEQTNGSSAIFNVSVRAWIALIVTCTVCLCFVFNIVMAVLGYTSATVTIGEPLYGAFGLVLGLYFGQKK